jgi:histidinol-phosphate/aromatic aminotransferase/cobyric acid decarboxylase-like protein
MAAVSTPAALAEVRACAVDYAGWRAHLMRGLRGLGLQPVDGQAPFVLVEVPEHTRESLRRKGYAVRRGDTFPGLGPTWIRLAVRDPHRCDGLLRELARTLDHRETA